MEVRVFWRLQGFSSLTIRFFCCKRVFWDVAFLLTIGSFQLIVELFSYNCVWRFSYNWIFTIGVFLLRVEGFPCPKINCKYWVLTEDLCKKDPCNFNMEMFVSKVGQPMSNSWSTSSQPDSVRTLGSRKTARNRQGKILYTELLKSWPTLGQRLANSPPHGKLQRSSGNEQNTVSRVLFRRKDSKELTEPHWVLGQTRWALRKKTRWVRFGTQIIGWKELTEFAPQNSVSPKNSLSSVFETVFGPFPSLPCSSPLATPDIGARTTHHPHKRPSSLGGIFGGWYVTCPQLGPFFVPACPPLTAINGY